MTTSCKSFVCFWLPNWCSSSGSRPPRKKLSILVVFFSVFLVLVLGLVDHSMHSSDGFLTKYGSFHFRNDWSSRNNFRKRPNTTATRVAPLAPPRGNEADRKTYDVTVCFSAMLAFKWVPLPRAKESLLTGNWDVYKEYNQCQWTVLKIHERDRRWWNNKADVGRTAAPKLRRGRLLSCPPSSPSTRNWAKYIHSKSLRCKTS